MHREQRQAGGTRGPQPWACGSPREQANKVPCRAPPHGGPCLLVKGRIWQAALGFRKQTLWGPLVFAFVLNLIQSGGSQWPGLPPRSPK